MLNSTPKTSPTTAARSAVVFAALSLLVASCSGDDDTGEQAGDDTTSVTTPETPDETMSETPDETPDETTGAPDESAQSGAISQERCEANRDAGTVTWVTAFDFAPAAGIAELVVADANGYFDELCIDVEIQSGFAPSNGALVIEGQAQMGMAGSFSELVANNVAGEGDLVALLHWGRTAVEEIVIPAGVEATSFADLCGTTVGIKGDLPYSLQAAVALSGVERSCFDEVLLDGFDPVQHLELGLDALPVYKSNEPFVLDNAGFEYTTLDPLDFDVPASFGIAFTTQSFIDDHPETVQDIVRALVKGYQDAAADPDATVAASFELINAAGNPNFLAMESELNRWKVESGLIAEFAPDGIGIGIPDTELLGAEVDAMVAAGVFDEAPDWMSMVDASIAESVYDGTDLIYPG